MGNRAIIKTPNGRIGMYLHWNGGRDSVSAFLQYCKLKGYRPPEADGYGWARLAQVVGNFFGGTLSVGIVMLSGVGDGEGCDNGAYVIKDWEIIAREDFHGIEQNRYKLDEMLVAIDEAQPEAERLGDYLRAKERASDSLKVGDVVYVSEIDGKPQKVKVVGFGANRIVNGTNVAGKPIVDRFVDVDGSFETNINNYILDATVRIE